MGKCSGYHAVSKSSISSKSGHSTFVLSTIDKPRECKHGDARLTTLLIV